MYVTIHCHPLIRALERCVGDRFIKCTAISWQQSTANLPHPQVNKTKQHTQTLLCSPFPVASSSAYSSESGQSNVTTTSLSASGAPRVPKPFCAALSSYICCPLHIAVLFPLGWHNPFRSLLDGNYVVLQARINRHVLEHMRIRCDEYEQLFR